MNVPKVLSKLFRRWRRSDEKDLKLWLQAWSAAYELAYFILLDPEMAKSVAYSAMLALKGGYKRRRHNEANRKSYQKKAEGEGASAKLRRLQLPDYLEMVRWVFFYATEMELEKATRDDVTRDDFDTWFIKCVIQHCLKRSNAFSATLGVSAGVYSYTPKETISIWFEMVEAISRSSEAWEAGNEPYDAYWSKLRDDIRKRFGHLIHTDHKGNLIRRDVSRQPKELVTLCLSKFAMQEDGTDCLSAVKASGGDALIDDGAAELRRFHIALHPPCYAALVARTGLSLPVDKIGLPEYTIAMSNNQGNNVDRRPPRLNEQELDDVRGELQRLFKLRRTAPAALVITVDGVGQNLPSETLSSTGRVRLRAHEGAQAIEVLAQREDGEKVLLTGCLLSHASGVRSVALEGGQRLHFDFNYVEDETGDGFYEIEIDYRETSPVRIASFFWQRLKSRRSARRRHGQRKVGALAPVLMSLLVMICAGAALYVFWPSPQIADQRQPHESEPQPKETAPQPAPLESNIGGTPSDERAADGKPPLRPASDENQAGQDKRASTDGHEPAITGQPKPEKQETTAAVDNTSPDGRQRQTHAPKDDAVASVERVYLGEMEIYKDEALEGLNLSIRDAQKTVLEESGAYKVVKNKDEAQAVLRIISGYRSTGQETVRPRLETRAGKLLWEGPHIPFSRDVRPEEMAKEVERLGTEIRDALLAEKEREQDPKLPKRPAR